MRQILFDVDGTLADTRGIIQDAMATLLKRYGYPEPDMNVIRETIGLPLLQTLSLALARPVDDEIYAMADDYLSLCQQLQAEKKNEHRLFDGIEDLINDLARCDDVLLGIVTGKARQGLMEFLNQHNFQELFSVSRCSDDCPSKPHPTMVLECCRETGIRPGQTFVIGDTSFDMAMAKSADAIGVGVGWGYQNADELEQSGAKKVVHTVEDLRRYLDSHFDQNEPSAQSTQQDILQLDEDPGIFSRIQHA